jgi:1-acyl-sn-glycerol-3-phosphate acyltransferase
VKAANTINAAAAFAKANNRALVIFPEHTPSKELRDFGPRAFKIAQKFFLPIVPVSISNLDKVNYRDLKLTDVKVKFHKPMKPMQFMNLKADRIANLVKQ